jgi:hypothetical protein
MVVPMTNHPLERMTDEQRHSAVRETMAKVTRRRAELFSLLTDDLSESTACAQVAEHFDISTELAEVVLDQQLKTFLRTDNW